MSWGSARGHLKAIVFGYVPGLSGSFPYFGSRVYFPRGSLAFKAACEQGIYEHDNLKLILRLLRQGSTYFDIGANIGLMAVPVVKQREDVTVVSFEPSPVTFSFLSRTHQNSNAPGRWKLVKAAADVKTGTRQFHALPTKLGVLDGFADTGRARGGEGISVETTTIDAEWEKLGKPDVSVIKVDVEGAELDALGGGERCIEACRPSILTECNLDNLRAYDRNPMAMIRWADDHGYRLLSVPSLSHVDGPRALEAAMCFTESFLMIPARQ